MQEIACKLLVIGGGPGGYVCAIRAGQLNIDTVLVEQKALGGTCLNVGCIPSKALIHAADEFARLTTFAADGGDIGISAGSPRLDFAKTQAWKTGVVQRLTGGVAHLLKGAGVKVIEGQARFRDGKSVHVSGLTGEQLVRAEAVVIATGSEPVQLPDLPFGGPVLSSTEALALPQVPERLAVVGAGYIGLEIGTAYAKLGSRVTVVEAEDRILPLYDADLAQPVAQRLRTLGVETLLNARARRLHGDALVVATGDGDERQLPADRVLVAVGRRPRLDDWGLEELALERDGRALRIDDRCRTSMRGVYAIGDVTGEPMLAHRAMAQGAMVAELVAGERRAWDKRCVPAICFTDPEVVSAGLSPEAARATGAEIRIGRFPFRANGRALATGREDGWVRIVARADNGLILGVQAVGAGVAELAAEFALALEMGATLEDLAATIHPHPSRSEAVPEAALGALGHSLHL
ncbi:MAG: dihydrolipoyl dehydrogenase [Alphaproteobacteria bacterium]|nr:dihydrolipoyl dehydrogenase [Alphaproteobacteria bacterium]MCB9930272.1 dihydrolipoyl dehydrogenase [Alphaproteobacteria bacterium]